MGSRIRGLREKVALLYVLFFIVFVLLLFPFGYYLFTLIEQSIEGPSGQIEIKKAITLAIILFSAAVLFFFGVAFWLVFQRLTRPMQKSLRRIVNLERDFIANASHELKTPITIIRGFAETLHDHPELTRSMVQEITRKIVSNCERMGTLVKNLLTLASIDEGIPQGRLRECDLMDLALEAQEMVLTVHPDAQIEVEQLSTEPCTLMCDPDLMLQAILNLIDNAVKYSKPPAQVRVALERRGSESIVSVTDKGIGIPKAETGRIFERFYSVDKSYSRTVGGSGLGLSIVRGIVDRHRGRIEVESELGKGSSFRIFLPQHKAIISGPISDLDGLKD